MLKMDNDGLSLRLPTDYIDESSILPNNVDFSNFTQDFIKISENSASSTSTVDVNVLNDSNYEQFLADIWVGIVLTLMVLSCVCFMCTCLIYHKFQQWKIRGKLQQNC